MAVLAFGRLELSVLRSSVGSVSRQVIAKSGECCSCSLLCWSAGRRYLLGFRLRLHYELRLADRYS